MFENTKREIERKIESQDFDAYALIIGYKGEDWQFMSDGVDLDTYFDAASVGKVYPTTALALQAIGKGLLSLDDTLEKFFSNVPEDKKNITVKNLLTHTSGLIRTPYPENIAERGRDSVIEFLLSKPLVYEPGSHFAYCCDGIMLIGLILEKVYGAPLEEVFRIYMKEPLGLTRTTYHIAIDEENMVMCNHRADLGGIIYDDNNVRQLRGIPAGNGGNFITAGDLQKFVKAIIEKDERLCANEMFDLAEKNYTAGLPVLDGDRSTENHGLGFVYVNENCEQACDLFPEGSIGHVGWSGQSFFLNRELGLYVILLTNSMRYQNLKKNLKGGERDKAVHQMRIDIHRAIKKDLGL
ncbi:MAG: beta-lactamase family protein [Ruminococcaceae bacterium]|nr:beta-lactamase family protein [Oscillospiraceae bacterium]